MKPILEMNDEELYQFYLDNKNKDKVPKIIAVLANDNINMLKSAQLKGYSKRGAYIDYEQDDIEVDMLKIVNDALIFKIKEA